MNVLQYKPFLVKPNNHELGEMFGVTLKTDEEIEKYARKLKDMGLKFSLDDFGTGYSSMNYLSPFMFASNTFPSSFLTTAW